MGTLVGATIVAFYCNLGTTPLATVVIINAVLFVAITSRMISAQALISGVPDLTDRGAFMSVNASVQQFAGGVASSLAGLIVVQAPDGHLLHYDVLGYVVVSAMTLTIALMYPINRAVMRKAAALAASAAKPAAVAPAAE